MNRGAMKGRRTEWTRATTVATRQGVVDVWQEVSLSCNLRCGFCYNNFQAFPRQVHTRGPSLSSDDARQILDAVRDVAPLNRVSLAGGEVFLHRCWRELVSIVRSYGCECVMVTNGTALKPGVECDLRSLGVDLVQFSLHGASGAVHDRIVGRPGAFDALLEAAARVAAAGVNIGFTYVWQGQLVWDLVRVVEWASVLGASFVVINEVRSASGPGDTAEALQRKARFLAHLRSVDEYLEPLDVPVIAASFIPRECRESWDLSAISPIEQHGRIPRLHIDPQGNLRRCLSSPVPHGSLLKGTPRSVVGEYLAGYAKRRQEECQCVREADLWGHFSP